MTNRAGVHRAAAAGYTLIGGQRITLDVVLLVNQTEGDVLDRLLKHAVPPRLLVVSDLAPNLFPRFLWVEITFPSVFQRGGVLLHKGEPNARGVLSAGAYVSLVQERPRIRVLESIRGDLVPVVVAPRRGNFFRTHRRCAK